MNRRCPSCDLVWRQPVSTCVRCGGPLTDSEPTRLRVLHVTKVEVPSLTCREVPYYCVLAEDDEGRHFVRKSSHPNCPGDILAKEDVAAKPGAFTVAVVGTGTMGVGLAQVAVQAGCSVIWKSRAASTLEKGAARVREHLLRAMAPEDVDAAFESVRLVTEFEPLQDAEVVIESVTEDLPTKRETFRELSRVCPLETILASNTSSLSIDALADGVPAPERVIGMHFFNPVHRMRLVEIVRGTATSQTVVDKTCRLADHLGKMPIVVRDSPGFIVNRILMPYLNEAVRLAQEGTASITDIDTAAELGLSHPIGPLALVDLIGVDVFVSIMRTLVARSGESRFQPAELALSLVEQGKLGRKSGSGFHDYGENSKGQRPASGTSAPRAPLPTRRQRDA